MANTRNLTESEIQTAKAIVEKARLQITEAARDDEALLWAMRRYVYLRLLYDERGTPMQRRALKRKKRAAQNGKCSLCAADLPEKGAELDRFEPMKGYTAENTQLICHACHRSDQEKKGFA